MVEVKPLILALWGKTLRNVPDRYHPLFFHLLDVGNVVKVLLNHAAADHWVREFARLIGISMETARGVLAFLIALHDLGKASPSFQLKDPSQWAELASAGFKPNPNPSSSFQHGLETYGSLSSLLRESGLFQVSKEELRFYGSIALALGSHHGRFFSLDELSKHLDIKPDGNDPESFAREWLEARVNIMDALKQEFLPGVSSISVNPQNLSALCVLLNGLTILCDWIGSDETYFPLTGALPLEQYRPLTLSHAQKAVEQRGLLRFGDFAGNPSFQELFPDKTPRPLQSALNPDTLTDLSSPFMAIIEAPMGEGKTEAALLLAQRAISTGARGFYVALPTVATSNQIFNRVKSFLESVYPKSTISLLLVNGRASMWDDYSVLLDKANSTRGDDDSDGPCVQIDTWLLPRKRSLLSPYAVGTVDQVMKGALHIRHGALRLLGLAGKVVIIDEIHAYDTYMSTIIVRLVEWLRELGSSVILLSATLTQSKRQELLRAYGVPQESLSGGNAYPLISLAQKDQPLRIIEPGASAMSKTVRISYRSGDPSELNQNASFLLSQVENGGTACWICNTVEEAQKSFQALKDHIEQLPEANRPALFLYHARFLLKDRLDIENGVLTGFGPGGTRLKHAILVATQVVEQSLDIDFDIMITQLAPIDLILQRMGRLHRHLLNRPESLRQPHLIILLPPVVDGVPRYGDSGLIYSPFILSKTLLTLNQRSTITIPDEIRPLVESVYDDQMPIHSAILSLENMAREKQEMAIKIASNQAEAKRRLLGAPDPRGGFHRNRSLEVLDDDLSDLNEWASGQTRLGEPSASVILLEKDHPLVDLLQKEKFTLTREQLKELNDNSVSISKKALLKYLAEDPTRWVLTQPSALRGKYLLPLENGTFTWKSQPNKTYHLMLSHHLGIQIEEEAERCDD